MNKNDLKKIELSVIFYIHKFNQIKISIKILFLDILCRLELNCLKE